MTNIPSEIWYNICHFMPAQEVKNLYALNSVFFDVAMDYRYRQLSFAYLDDRTIRSLVRLKDPFVASRVRILHVYPAFLKEGLGKEKGRPTQGLRRKFWDKFTELAALLAEQQKIFIRPRDRRKAALSREEDAVATILEVLSGLPNVTAYYVTWCGLPSISHRAAPLLSTALQGSLQKLSLELSLENMESLLTPSFLVENLKELHLCIHPEGVRRVEERDRILGTYLAPAISRMRDKLQLFHIQSWEPADLSPFFREVGILPCLTRLVVAIPVEVGHLGDPAGLTEFLSAHRLSLNTLALRATQYGGKGLEPTVVSFDTWVREAMAGVTLPKLQTLDISTSLFPAETSLFCLQQLSSRACSIALTGYYRSYEELEDVMDIIEHRRSPVLTLRLAVKSLSPQVVDLLAAKAPHLDRLDLAVKHILPHYRDTPELFRIPQSSGSSQVQEWSQIDNFLTQMEARRYPDWRLRHLSIVAEYLPSRSQDEHLLEQAFSASVPSLRWYS